MIMEILKKLSSNTPEQTKPIDTFFPLIKDKKE